MVCHVHALQTSNRPFNSLWLCEIYWCQDRKITFKEPGVHSLRLFFLQTYPDISCCFQLHQSEEACIFNNGTANFSNIFMKGAI